MKLMKNLSYFLILLIPLFLSHCGTASDPPPKQVFELVEAWTSDPVDVDQDGFQSTFRVNFELSVNTGSKDVYAWLGLRYYDSQDTALYYQYFESANIEVTSGGTNSWYISIGGSPETPDLPQAAYDFFLIIFDTEDERLAQVSANDLSAFSNVPVEPAETDIGIAIFDAWFQGGTDNDGDGYNSEDILWVDVDESSDQGADVWLGLSYRLSGTSTYTVLGATEPFTVTGDASEDVVGVEVTDIESFSHNMYDFKVDLMYDGWGIIEDTSEPPANSSLGSVQLELASEDIPQTLSVWDAWWSQVQDNDLDAYYSEVVITIDADVSTGTAEVYFRIYSKTSTEQSYAYMGDTTPFTITGSSSTDDRSYLFYDFPRGLYDLRFELLFYGSSTVQDTYDDTDDVHLDNIPFETYADDGL